MEEKLPAFVSSGRALPRATGPLFGVKLESERHKGERGMEELRLAELVLGLWSDWERCQGWDWAPPGCP